MKIFKKLAGIAILAFLYCVLWLIITAGAVVQGISLVYAMFILPIATVITFLIIGGIMLAVDFLMGD